MERQGANPPMTTPSPGVDRRNAAMRAVADFAAIDGIQPEGEQVPPLAGIRAAAALRDEAVRQIDGHVQFARQAGHGWQAIGEALGYPGGVAAAAAYRVLATERELYPGWICPACDQAILDAGPGMPPADAESGHATACARLAEATAAWEAAR